MYVLQYLLFQFSLIITIDQAAGQPQLVITAPSEIDEDESFAVLVTVDGFRIQNVSISFNNITYYSNINGLALFPTPMVQQDTNFTISASKDGYLPASSWIWVLDSEDPPDEQLIITSPSEVFEGEQFNVLVTVNSTPIPNVILNFSNIIQITS